MSDIASPAAQVGVPYAVDVQPVRVPGGAGMVVVQVANIHGAFVFALPAKDAIEFGKRTMGAGRASLTGLTIVGNVGGVVE